MVHLDNVTKVYRGPRNEVRALDGVSLRVEAGEFLVVKGPSGSGKSTLLLTMGGMVRPTEGRVVVGETDLYALSPRERARFRALNVGFVFQVFHLLPYLTVLENALLPTLARIGGHSTFLRRTLDGACGEELSSESPGQPVQHARKVECPHIPREEALALLERFGLADRLDHKPSELSIGERQRVAMARALLNRPKFLLADEPTGNLDSDNAARLMTYLAEFHGGGGTVVVVTHEELAERYAGRIVLIRNGRIER